jgi:diketogulonate reductase-like aldo/keto reductase
VKLTREEFLRLASGAFGALVVAGGKQGRAVYAPTNAPTSTKNPVEHPTMKDHHEEMMKRPIPVSGELMPIIGLGTWQTFDVTLNAGNRARLGEVIRLLIDGGGKMIDSSPMYGRAEAVVGDLVAEMGVRDRLFIATKVWTSGREQGIEQMRRSAELLRVRVIDLMQVHNLVDWRTQLATLRRMKEAGQVRYIGVTHYLPSAFGALADVMTREQIDFVQLPYSIETREAETRLLPLAADRNIAVIVNRPFEGGDLFRRVRRTALPAWAADFGCATWAQFFLKFIVSNPAVTCVIPATDKPEHLADDLKGGYGRLPDASERRRVVDFWRTI